jgi:four helix bundle protein
LVWQKAHRFVFGVHPYTSSFPKHEVSGLSNQFRRAAVSVAADIAEGFRRCGRADKGRFMNLAEASLDECRYYLILASDLGYGGQ